MRRLGPSLVLSLVTAAVLGAAPASAQVVVPVEELIANPDPYAGERVTVRGELIGDYGFRANGFMWTQLNDDSYAIEPVAEGGPLTGGNVGIGIRIPEDMARPLDPPGGYRLRGPLVLVSGVFLHHDPSRQGETYIAVDGIEVLEPGRQIDEGFDWPAAAIGAGMLALAILLHWSRRRSLNRV